MSNDTQNLPPWGETRVVGKGLPRVDAYERVSGTAVYPIDVSFPDMLYAAVLRCPHAHAKVKKVNVPAKLPPGVRAVITDATPGARIAWYDGKSRLFDPHCRYAGEEVAAVAAETPYQAAEALKAITVEYETLPFVVDAEEAMKPGAPAVQEGGNWAQPPRTWQRGDVGKGFAEADAVLEQTYRTPTQIHACAEVHGAVARWEGDKLTVWDTMQGVFDNQQSLADALGLPLSSVRVICPYMGGGFGSKLELSKHTVIAALLARITARPVRLFLTREDSFLCVGNRPADIIRLKAGVKKDGTLTALEVINHGVVGAYPGGAGLAYQVMDLYLCPNARAEEAFLYVNAGKERAFRAPGFPQCSWALEQMMDALAEKIGMDPVELRLKNVPAVSQARNVPYTSTGLKQCLTEGASAFRWKESREKPRAAGAIKRGVGMGASIWGYEGEPNATVVVKLFPDGSANLNMGASDIGTGTKTIMAMVVAEELGVPPAKVQIEHADTATTQYAPGSGGSQTVLVSAPAVRAAAVEVRRQLLEIAAGEMKKPAAELSLRDGQVFASSEPDKGVPISKIKGLGERRVLMAVGTRHPHPQGKVALPFAAQFAEVEVNALTGEIKIVRFLAAHDSGRMMNRLTYENQVFGGVTQGIGYGTSEQRRLDRQTGRMVNANLHDYKIPTAMDVPPEMTCVPIDPHDAECNTAGAKGLGEPAMIATAAAIANAVYHATGVRVTEAPITPMRLAKLLAEQRAGR
jgi:xanthine dehydrogenase YagR molybdenum-binding subunit